MDPQDFTTEALDHRAYIKADGYSTHTNVFVSNASFHPHDICAPLEHYHHCPNTAVVYEEEPCAASKQQPHAKAAQHNRAILQSTVAAMQSLPDLDVQDEVLPKFNFKSIPLSRRKRTPKKRRIMRKTPIAAAISDALSHQVKLSKNMTVQSAADNTEYHPLDFKANVPLTNSSVPLTNSSALTNSLASAPVRPTEALSVAQGIDTDLAHLESALKDKAQAKSLAEAKAVVKERANANAKDVAKVKAEATEAENNAAANATECTEAQGKAEVSSCLGQKAMSRRKKLMAAAAQKLSELMAASGVKSVDAIKDEWIFVEEEIEMSSQNESSLTAISTDQSSNSAKNTVCGDGCSKAHDATFQNGGAASVVANNGRKGKGKATRMVAIATAVAALALSSMTTPVQAAPRAGLPVEDPLFKPVDVHIDRPPAGTVMDIKGYGHNALLVWKEFNVAKGNSVNFSGEHGQPISFLNVVKGPGASHIDGRISASSPNVNVYLINPNGIHMGKHAVMSGFKNVYLGTAKPSQELLDKFRDGSAPAVGLDALPSTRGMGKIVMMNKIEAEDLKVVGGHIVIGSANEVFSADAKPKSIVLDSSINRIDIGGNLDKAATKDGTTYREILKNNGYSAATQADISASGTLKKNTYVDHSQEQGIFDSEDFAKINNDLDGKYWLIDDIKLEDHVPIGKDANAAFTGSLDGAFNTISYEIEANSVDVAGNYGLFSSLDGATIKNLKLVDSYIDTDATVANQKLNIGSVAGSIKDSKLTNIEVNNFDVLLDETKPLNQDSAIGALAGSMSGNNSLDNVLTEFNADAEEALNEAHTNGTIKHAGTLVGKHSGNMSKNHVVVGVHGFEKSTLKGIGSSDAGASVATDFADAAAQALASGMSEDELYATYATEGKLDDGSLKLKHKTFLKPFYVEDFNYTYDGTDHNYLDKVNNKGFDINNLVSKTNKTDFTQSNAGMHSFELTTHKDSIDQGHEYYFSYKYASETWDDTAGGDAAIHNRTDRHDSISGTATLNINKKQLHVTIKDQIIDEGKQPNLKPGKDTIANYGELIQSGLVNGDKFEDLDITLTLKPDGTIVGSSNSDNYELTIDKGTLTVIVPPKPEPQPDPDPVPTPDPDPTPDPKPDHGLSDNVQPSARDNLLPKIAKCSHCADINGYKGAAAQTFLPSSSGLLTDNSDYSSSIYAALEHNATASDSEFNAYVLAHHSMRDQDNTDTTAFDTTEPMLANKAATDTVADAAAEDIDPTEPMLANNTLTSVASRTSIKSKS